MILKRKITLIFLLVNQLLNRTKDKIICKSKKGLISADLGADLIIEYWGLVEHKGNINLFCTSEIIKIHIKYLICEYTISI